MVACILRANLQAKVTIHARMGGGVVQPGHAQSATYRFELPVKQLGIAVGCAIAGREGQLVAATGSFPQLREHVTESFRPPVKYLPCTIRPGWCEDGVRKGKVAINSPSKPGSFRSVFGALECGKTR